MSKFFDDLDIDENGNIKLAAPEYILEDFTRELMIASGLPMDILQGAKRELTEEELIAWRRSQGLLPDKPRSYTVVVTPEEYRNWLMFGTLAPPMSMKWKV